MPKGDPGKGRQRAVGLLLTLLLYGLLPLPLAGLAVRGWTDAEGLLGPMLLSAAVSAAVGGAWLARRGKLSVFLSALLAGPGIQLLAALIGYLAFGGAGWDGGRWLPGAAGFAAALAAGLLATRRAGKRKDRGRRR